MTEKMKYFFALKLACFDVIALKESAGERLRCPWGPDVTDCDSKDIGACNPECPNPNDLVDCLKTFYEEEAVKLHTCPNCGKVRW